MTTTATPVTPAATADPMQTAEPRNGFGITALVLALIGLVFGLIPFTGFIALILGGLAVLFAFLGWGRTRRGKATNKKMNLFDGVLGAGAVALGIWGITITFQATEQFVNDMNQINQQYEQDMNQLDQQMQQLGQYPTPVNGNR